MIAVPNVQQEMTFAKAPIFFERAGTMSTESRKKRKYEPSLENCSADIDDESLKPDNPEMFRSSGSSVYDLNLPAEMHYHASGALNEVGYDDATYHHQGLGADELEDDNDYEEEDSPGTDVADDTRMGHRSNCWTRKEEVFLVGAVVHRFLDHGSLTSKTSKQGSKIECWESIKKKYDLAWRNYSAMTKQPVPWVRSANALCRHYKVMKARLPQNNEGNSNFHAMYDEWRILYNKDNKLLPSIPFLPEF